MCMRRVFVYMCDVSNQTVVIVVHCRMNHKVAAKKNKHSGCADTCAVLGVRLELIYEERCNVRMRVLARAFA